MTFRRFLAGRLELPVIGAPMFRASVPELVIAQCRAGIIGAMPSRSVRAAENLRGELRAIRERLAVTAQTGIEPAPFAINLVVHESNPRFAHDFAVCVDERVEIIITSLGISRAVIDQVHDYGGYVLHDVTNLRHARKAAQAGVDGIIAVCAGAGGHTGTLNPFAFLSELRSAYEGPVAMAGAINDGYAIAAAIAAGADLAYMGTRFIATAESGVVPAFRDMIIASKAADIITSSWLTGIAANLLAPSFRAHGLDPENLPPRHGPASVDTVANTAGWGEIWGAGQGVGGIEDSPPVTVLVRRLRQEFERAQARVAEFAGARQPQAGRQLAR